MPRSPISKRRLLLKRRPVLKDPVFGSEIVCSFINLIMRHGKKGVASKIVYGALNTIKEQFIKENRISEETFQKAVDEKRQILGLSEKEPLPDDKIGLVVFHQSINNARPYVKVIAKKVGGDTRQMTGILDRDGSVRRGSIFIKTAALMRRKTTKFEPGDKGMVKLLALELIDAYDNKGAAIKMRTDMHRMAKANQAYSYSRASANQEELPI